MIADRIGPWIGTVEPIDDGSCILDTGADSLEMLAVYLGLLDADFTVSEPPELVERVQLLASDTRGRARTNPVGEAGFSPGLTHRARARVSPRCRSDVGARGGTRGFSPFAMTEMNLDCATCGLPLGGRR